MQSVGGTIRRSNGARAADPLAVTAATCSVCGPTEGISEVGGSDNGDGVAGGSDHGTSVDGGSSQDRGGSGDGGSEDGGSAEDGGSSEDPPFEASELIDWDSTRPSLGDGAFRASRG